MFIKKFIRVWGGSHLNVFKLTVIKTVEKSGNINYKNTKKIDFMGK